jgi:hypothetical protein
MVRRTHPTEDFLEQFLMGLWPTLNPEKNPFASLRLGVIDFHAKALRRKD